jgi:Rod binding domain-containing protein
MRIEAFPPADSATVSTTAASTVEARRPSARLVTAAHEFEAALVGELLKPMQHDPLFAEPEEEEAGSGSQGAMRGFGTEAIARAISEKGGLGIARAVLERLGPQESKIPDSLLSPVGKAV